MNSYSETGKNFITDTNDINFPNQSLSNWMLLCMQAHGYDYNTKACTKKDEKTGVSDVFNDKCFEKMLKQD